MIARSPSAPATDAASARRLSQDVGGARCAGRRRHTEDSTSPQRENEHVRPTLFYSGSKNAFDAHQKELDSLGTSKYLGSDAGLAPLYDLALLSGMWGMFAGALHAVALVGTEKVEAREFMALLIPWIPAMVGGLPQLAEPIDTGDYTKDVVSNLGMQAVAYANLIEASKAQGVSTELIAPMQDLMNRGVAAGHGTADLSSLVESIKNPSTADLSRRAKTATT